MSYPEEIYSDAPVDLNNAQAKESGIALCLSGGGYRAMIFHVGAIWRLYEAGLLAKLDRISSVSGGSISAAVLGLNWSKILVGSSPCRSSLEKHFVYPLRKLASETIDAWGIIGGVLLPGTISEKIQSSY